LHGGIGLGGEHADFPWLHSQVLQKLSHLGRLAHNPGQGGNPRGGFRHRRGRPLPKLGLDRRAVRVKRTTWPARLEVLELFNAPAHIGFEIAMEARFGNATQPRDVTIGDPLTAQIEGLHAYLDPWIGMLKPPMP